MFGQVQATETIAISGAAAAGVLLIREVAPLVFRYLSGRDKMAATQRSEIFERLDKCEQDRLALHDELGGLRRQVDQLNAELTEIREYTVAATIVADGEGEIVSWSHGAEILFRYGREEAMGQQLTMLIPLREHMTHRAAFTKATADQQLSAGAVISMRDAYGVRKDGTEIPLNIELAVVQVDPVQFGATIRKRMP